jgi:hypothetical protein
LDRSSLTHWRQRLCEEQLLGLIQGSLSIAHKTGALETRDHERIVLHTTVQSKAIATPIDAPLCHRALENIDRVGAALPRGVTAQLFHPTLCQAVEPCLIEFMKTLGPPLSAATD